MFSGGLLDRLLEGSFISGCNSLSIKPFEPGWITAYTFNLTLSVMLMHFKQVHDLAS